MHLARWLLLALTAVSGCLNDTPEATFVGGAEELRCEGVYPVCQGKVASCVLDEDHVIEGAFPGPRSVVVETDPGDWSIKVGVFFRTRVSPGTELIIRWWEPGCSFQYTYNTLEEGITDIFHEAGPDRAIEAEKPVADWGDHLIEVYSDATAEYLIKVELISLDDPQS